MNNANNDSNNNHVESDICQGVLPLKSEATSRIDKLIETSSRFPKALSPKSDKSCCDNIRRLNSTDYNKSGRKNYSDNSKAGLNSDKDKDTNKPACYVNINKNDAGLINDASAPIKKLKSIDTKNQIPRAKKISKTKCAGITLVSGIGSGLAWCLTAIALIPRYATVEESIRQIASSKFRHFEIANKAAGSVTKLGMVYMTKNTNFPKMIRYKIDTRDIDTEKDKIPLFLEAGDIVYIPPNIKKVLAGHMEIILETGGIGGNKMFTVANMGYPKLNAAEYSYTSYYSEAIKRINKKIFIYRIDNEQQRKAFVETVQDTTYSSYSDESTVVNDIKYSLLPALKPSSLFQTPQNSGNQGNGSEDKLDKSYCSQYVAFTFNKAFKGTLPGPSAGWTPARLHAAFSVHSDKKEEARIFCG
ncbi:MAG: hypothetical protein GY874_13555 [Desulfobacteraceae bacterium]|nr:hypothetical protein [Desulfobacteraceae bacterium]